MAIQIEGRSDAALIEKALKVHGLTPEQCLAAKTTATTVTLVTTGGQKIKWSVGDRAVEIPAHQHPDAKPKLNRKKNPFSD